MRINFCFCAAFFGWMPVDPFGGVRIDGYILRGQRARKEKYVEDKTTPRSAGDGVRICRHVGGTGAGAERD